MLTVIGFVRMQTLTVNTLCVAVSVNPETQRHIRISHQVKDSTTRNVGIFVAVTVAILNKHNAKNRRNSDVVDSVRRAEDVEEHVVNCECVESSNESYREAIASV